MAKKKRTITTEQVKGLGRLQCLPREAAAFLNIRVDTFNRLLRDDPKMKEAWEKGKALGCISLRRKQARLAGTNAAMSIFLGKQWLGQKDVVGHEIGDSEGQPLNLDHLSREERDELRQLIEKGSDEEEDS